MSEEIRPTIHAKRFPKDGGPAFPVFTFGGSFSPLQGMTLLDYFAGQALVGLLAGRESLVGPKLAAEDAYAYAAAMVAEKERRISLWSNG